MARKKEAGASGRERVKVAIHDMFSHHRVYFFKLEDFRRDLLLAALTDWRLCAILNEGVSERKCGRTVRRGIGKTRGRRGPCIVVSAGSGGAAS